MPNRTPEGDLSPTKVLFVSEVDLSAARAAGVATQALVRAIADQPGVDLTVVAPRSVADRLAWLSGGNIRWVGLPVRRRRSLAWQLRMAYEVRMACRKLLRTEAFDLGIIRYGPFFLFARGVLRRSGVSLVLLVRGRALLGEGNALQHLLAHGGRWLRHLSLRGADRIVLAFEDAVPDRVRRSLGDRVELIPNAADVDRFALMGRDDARAVLREDWSIDLTGKVLGFAGGMQRRHGLESLLEASELLQRRGREHTLLLVGDGPMRNEISRQREALGWTNWVVLPGWVPQADLLPFLAACDALYGTVSSRAPSNPLKVYEALAAGRPVVTSPMPELAFVEERGFGVLVSGEDVDGIANGIEQVFAMAWGEEEARRARAYVVENHSWSRFARALLGRAPRGRLFHAS